MKKLLALVLAMLLALGCCAAFAEAEPITLDVIICQYGPNTQEWFLGKGMNGTNFVDKFQAENPDIKLNLQVVSWNDVYTEVSTRISNNNAPDILNIDVFANYAAEGLLLPCRTTALRSCSRTSSPPSSSSLWWTASAGPCRIWLPPAHCM